MWLCTYLLLSIKGLTSMPCINKANPVALWSFSNRTWNDPEAMSMSLSYDGVWRMDSLKQRLAQEKLQFMN